MSLDETIKANIRASLHARRFDAQHTFVECREREGEWQATIDMANLEAYGPKCGGKLDALVALCGVLGLADDGTDPIVALREKIEKMARVYDRESASRSLRDPDGAGTHALVADNLRSLIASPGDDRGR